MNFKRIISSFFLRLQKHPLLWTWMFLMSILSVIDIPGSPVFALSPFIQVLYVLSFSALKATLLCSGVLLLERWRVGKYFAYILVGIFSILALVNAFSYTFYDFGISRKMLLIFAQTTAFETDGMIPAILDNIISFLIRWSTLAVIATTVILFIILKKFPRKAFISVAFASVIGFFAFLIFTFNFSSGRTAHSLALRIAKYSVEVYRAEQLYQQLLSQAIPFPDADKVHSDHVASNFILVIGESASRKHHSIYGYPLPTNPRLSLHVDSLYIFSDVIGSSAATAGNMERILTFKEDDLTFGDGLRYPALIDLFNEAGYTTFWLSNQERAGTVSNTSSALARNADVITYVGADNSEDALLQRYDDVLLPHVFNAFASPDSNKLIVCHLLGSHPFYKDRFPKNRSNISPSMELNANINPPRTWLNEKSAQIVADYDNSIAFTDSILDVMIGMIVTSPKPSVLLYFSDHGENVYDEGDYTGRGVDYVDVPMILYLNPQYRAQNPDILNRLDSALSLPISNANIIHSMMTLTGTSYPLYNPKLDFLSPLFSSRIRYVDEAPLK